MNADVASPNTVPRSQTVTNNLPALGCGVLTPLLALHRQPNLEFQILGFNTSCRKQITQNRIIRGRDERNIR